MKKECIICGFNKKVEEHHIIKKMNFGDDSDKNKVYLCLNHHWIADFGIEEDRIIIINEIKKNTGKTGTKISKQDEDYLNLKIRYLIGQSIPDVIDDDKLFDELKNTSNYDGYLKMLLGRDLGFNSKKLHERAEKIILIDKLKRSLL